MAPSIIVLLSIALLASAQSITLSQPAASISAATNFTWTYSGFTGLAIPATNVSLQLFAVSGANSTVPLAVSSASAAAASSASSTTSASASTRTPLSATSTTSRTTTTTPIASAPGRASVVTLTTIPTTVLLASTTTVTVDGAPITVPLEEPVATDVVATVSAGAVVHGRRLSTRQSPATILFNAPLSQGYYTFDPTTVSPGWYVLVAVTESSLSTLATAVSNTTAFQVMSASSSSSSSGLSTGAKAGIAVGVIVAALVALIVGGYYLRKRRNHRRVSTSSDWAQGMNGDIFQSQWRRSLHENNPPQPTPGLDGHRSPEAWEFEKSPESVPMSPMALAVTYPTPSSRQTDPFAEKDDGLGSGDTTVSRQSSMMDHTQPLQHNQHFPSMTTHPYNPYLYNPGTQPIAVPSPAATSSASTLKPEHEQWALNLPSFFESTSTSPRASATTQGRASRESLPPSAFPGGRKLSGPSPPVVLGTAPLGRAGTRPLSTQAPPVPPRETRPDATRSTTDLPVGALGRSSPEADGADRQKSNSLHNGSAPSGSANSRGPRRKAVPAYQPEVPLPTSSASNDTAPRLSLPPSSPFLPTPSAAASSTSLAIPDTRKSSLSVSGTGVDPALVSGLAEFEGSKAAQHVLIPDFPVGYQGRR